MEEIYAAKVNLGYSKLDDGIAELAAGSSTSDVSAATSDVFPPAGYHWRINQTTGKLTTTMGIDLGGNSIQNVSAIMSASGNWRIDESGKLVVEEVKAKRIELEDEDTGEQYCVRIKSGEFLHTQGTCSSSIKTENPTVSDGVSGDSAGQSSWLVTNSTSIAEANFLSSNNLSNLTEDALGTMEVGGIEPPESQVTNQVSLPSTPTADTSYQEINGTSTPSL